MAPVQIYYTADIVRPDGSDSDVYGDPCEPGCGATLEMGWIDPDWSRDTVYEERESVRPDTWEPDDGPMIDWIVNQVTKRLSLAEGTGDSRAHCARTYYAREADTHPYTGVSVSMAAHIDAPPAILAAVSYALARMSRYPYPDYVD